MSAPLLLHSLSEFRTIMLRLFAAAQARTFVEIGSETGAFTRELVSIARERDGHVTTVEPFPADEVLAYAREEERFTLVQGLSPAALDDIEPADAWIVDGDHNHWTVEREVDAALDLGERAGRPPLLIMHDVGWPCGRRDFYYDPSALPADAVLPHSYAHGVVPGDPGVVRSGGSRGEGVYAVALREGGPRNGVLTAIEDVMRRRGDLELAILPVVYGVGVIFPAGAPWAGAVREVLTPYDRLDLLERLEDNRLRLYVRVLELQDELRRLDAARNRTLGALDDRVAELELENATLRVELARRRAAAA